MLVNECPKHRKLFMVVILIGYQCFLSWETVLPMGENTVFCRRKQTYKRFLIFDLHQCDADDNPDDFADTADDAHEDAEGGGEAKGGNGKDETALLDT